MPLFGRVEIRHQRVALTIRNANRETTFGAMGVC
jgi:hypothetical protein